MQEIFSQFKSGLDGVFDRFRSEVASLRTGRATPALVEDITIEQYGTKTPLKHVASISTPDAKSIIIQPWDRGLLEAIGKAIEVSPLHLNPIAGTDSIRLTLPQLTEERRKDLLKILHAKAEEARVQSRKRRDESLKKVQEMEKEKKISEDDKYRAKDELQKIIDEFNKNLEDARERKEKEVMEV